MIRHITAPICFWVVVVVAALVSVSCTPPTPKVGPPTPYQGTGERVAFASPAEFSWK